MAPEFREWPKTPRLFRDMVVTEKIDGTNAAVIVEYGHPAEDQDGWCWGGAVRGTFMKVGAQSRKRVITPEADNFGFAAWVRRHAATLAEHLGEGHHFGEWWGHGIQRGYGLSQGDRRFSLFNVNRYDGLTLPTEIGVGVVPTLQRLTFDTTCVLGALDALRANGSVAAPGFDRPEGVVVFHSAAGKVFKALLDGDDRPKGEGE